MTCVLPIVVASTSPHKIAELKAVGQEFGLRFISPLEAASEQSISSPPPVVEETGSSYLQNARLKAQAFSTWAALPAVGDDTGLEVDALGGAPGLFTSRYAGPGASNEQRIGKLLDALSESQAPTHRKARFRTVLLFVEPGTGPGIGEISAEGTSEGVILDAPLGSRGAGYDPIVLLDDLGKTLAEVDFATTCAYGFRGKAARRLCRILSGRKVATCVL